MRKNLYSFLLTALCSMLGLNVWAQDLNSTFIDGTEYYEIGTANDLATLANLVNSGEEMDANAVLTADIDMADLIAMDGWTAIGNWASTANGNACYKGHFNGQGHKITGFNATTTHNYYGIFGVISSCLIENFSVYGTLTNTTTTAGVCGYGRDETPTVRNVHSYLNINNTRVGSRLGGILGTSHNGSVIVDRCTYSGTMDGNDNENNGNYGGIVGYVNNNANSHLKITNCLFDGQLINTAGTPGGCTFGGMAGYVGANPDVTITNCLSIGTVQSAVTGQFYGAVKHNTCSIINSFYQGDNINGSSSTVTPTTQEVTKVTDQQLASGEICYALNESVSGGENWFQTLNDDNYPFPYNGGIHDPIYLNGRQHCDGTAYEDAALSNQDLGIATDDHDFQNGFCAYCGELDETFMTAGDEGYFEIGTPAQLKWFAFYVNTKDAAANAILTADIDLAGVAWTPIGKGVYYGGTFDGQGFTVSNLTYVGSGDCNGLFGGVKDATIKNFSVNGSLVCDGSWTGAIGRAENSTICNVHSTLTIETPTSGVFHHAGGVVGGSYNPTTVDRCSFNGTLTVNAESHDCFGGIVGYTTDYCMIKNCINYGNVSFAKNNCYAGGIVGYINSAACYGAHNCLNVGKVEYTGEGDVTYSGAIVGRLRGNNPALWGYSYYLAGSAVNASGENQIPTNFEVTAEQLANGETAAELTPYIRQNIGQDAYPVLDATHNVVTKITDAGYATLFVPNAEVAVPAGVTAYTAEIAENERNGKQHLALAELEGSIPAQTAVILKGAEGIYEFAALAEEVPDGAFKIFDKEVDGSLALVKGWAAPVQENVLKGAAEDVDAAGKYVLAKVDGKACFALATSGTIKAGKAYLEIASDAKAFYFSFDDATGINKLNESNGLNNVIYNLAGQRVGKMQRGINITGGKKILK